MERWASYRGRQWKSHRAFQKSSWADTGMTFTFLRFRYDGAAKTSLSTDMEVCRGAFCSGGRMELVCVRGEEQYNDLYHERRSDRTGRGTGKAKEMAERGAGRARRRNALSVLTFPGRFYHEEVHQKRCRPRRPIRHANHCDCDHRQRSGWHRCGMVKNCLENWKWAVFDWDDWWHIWFRVAAHKQSAERITRRGGFERWRQFLVLFRCVLEVTKGFFPPKDMKGNERWRSSIKKRVKTGKVEGKTYVYVLLTFCVFSFYTILLHSFGRWTVDNSSNSNSLEVSSVVFSANALRETASIHLKQTLKLCIKANYY